MRYDAIGQTILWVLERYSEIAPAFQPPAALEEPPIEVDILRDIIRERSGLTTIAWEEIDANTNHLLGNIKFYYPVPRTIRTNEEPTTAIIRFKKELNFCWRRFVVTKEMCHCLIDTEEDRVYDTEKLKKLAEGLASLITLSIEDHPLMTEQLAEVMALEILFPLEYRRAHIDAYKAGLISQMNLALRYRIPVEFAEIGMYENQFKLSEWIRGQHLLK